MRMGVMGEGDGVTGRGLMGDDEEVGVGALIGRGNKEGQ